MGKAFHLSSEFSMKNLYKNARRPSPGHESGDSGLRAFALYFCTPYTFLLLATCYLLLATCYLLLATPFVLHHSIHSPSTSWMVISLVSIKNASGASLSAPTA